MDASELPAEEEKLSVRIRRQYMARLIGLSDGVFAIAITLSALEIHMPYTESDRIETILMELFPVLTPYLVSFAVISLYWLAHRRLIARLTHIDAPATLMSLCFLGLVALQPASVQMLSHGGTMSVIREMYFLLVLVTATLHAAMWLHAGFIGHLLDPSLSRSYRIARLMGALTVPLLISIISIYLSLAL